MKKRKITRLISCILALVMLLSMVPVLNISAAEVEKAQVAESSGTTDDGFEYIVSAGEVEITGYSGSDADLVIPSEISGYPVLYIGDYAFEYCSFIESVVISEGIEYIGMMAFYGCDSILSIMVPESVTLIGSSAFDLCYSLQEVKYCGTEEQWENIDIDATNLYLTNPMNIVYNYQAETDEDETEAAEPILIYFMDTLGWEDITLCYKYLDDDSVYTRDMEWDYTNEYGDNIYVQSVPADVDVIYFEGSGKTTIFIYGISDGICYYCYDEIAPNVYDINIYEEDSTGSYEPEVEYVTGTFFESDHNYASDTDKTWIIEAEGATSIVITFSADTFVEEDWDYIYISNENDELVGEYTGDALASRTITVRGSAAKVQLLADSSNEYYGFSAEYEAVYGDSSDPTEPPVEVPTEPEEDPTEPPAEEPDTDPTEVPTEPEDVFEFGVDIGSEIFEEANVGDKVRYTVELSAQELFEDFEATLTYNSDCLELVGLFDEYGEELTDMYDIGAVMCPNLYSPFVNSEKAGVIRFFDVNLDGNDFTQGNVLLTVEFIVKDTSYSELSLQIDELTLLGGEDSYFTDGEAVITDGICITKSIEITEYAPEPTEPRIFTVVFLDHDGKFIEVQLVSEGDAAVAPAEPNRKGYTFSGWDADIECVTENLVVKATYTKDSQSPSYTPTTGTLKVEVAGGKGFYISLNGGDLRAQGASYLNSQLPIGTQVYVEATAVAGTTFIGWMNPNTGVILSSDYSYRFTATGNDSIKAMYAIKIENVQMVSFKNSKANQILDTQYYAQDEPIQFPAAPTQVGYDFAGWNMTEAEIQSAIAAGRDVVVEATWTRQIVKVQVTVTNGSGTGQYNALAQVTVTANEPEDGKKFAYWTDAEGNIKSYAEIYSFFPTQDTEVIAVFVSEDTVVEEQILVSLDAIDTTGEKNVFYYTWNVPESYPFVKAGIIAVNKDNLSEATFYAGTTDSNVYDRSPSGSNLKPANSWSWSKSNVASGETWVAKAYVQYRDVDGTVKTVYSDLVEATRD